MIRMSEESIIKKLEELGSYDCEIKKLKDGRTHILCGHDKDDGFIFEAREGEEDDDFPIMIGKEIIYNAVKKIIPSKKVEVIDHEKGLYSVLIK